MYLNPTGAGLFLTGQNLNSLTPPPGFSKYLGFQTTTAYTPTAGDYYHLAQSIEGYNVADLMWGTPYASPVTISFWVRSSIAGLFGGALIDSANTQSYVLAYTINAPNTWEYKTITVPGCTSGSNWNTTNSTGIKIRLGVGTGPTYSGPASGSWYAGAYFNVTGARSVVSVSGATFYITGVKLEKGTLATPFEVRPYNVELSLCQRYYYRLWSGGNPSLFAIAVSASSDSNIMWYIQLPVPMRASPTCSSSGATTLGTWPMATGGSNILGSSYYSLGGVSSYPYQHIEVMLVLASSPGTQVHRVGFRSNAGVGYIDASAEL
jgi:hypothetical protein